MRGSNVGVSDTLKTIPAVYRNFISVLDCAFSCLVVAPAVVSFWRSVWELMGIYVYPERPVISALISLTIGFAGHVSFCLVQVLLSNNFHPDKHRILYYVVSRIYTILYGVACVNSWRGSWLLLDMYTRFDQSTVITTTVVSVGILVLIRTIRNVSAPPFVVVYDSVDEYFTVPTMFRTSNNDKYIFHVLDCIFSVFIIGSLVIVVWRGSWVMLDLFFYASDFEQSSWNSLFLGYLIVCISYGLQTPMYKLCNKANIFGRFVLCDSYLLFSFFATVNLWRGVWNLINIYFLPDEFVLSCWITFWCSLVVLILLKCSNSLLVRGVYIDAEEPSGKCVILPIFYFRTMIEHERARKRAQSVDLETLLKKLKPYMAAVNSNSTTIKDLESISKPTDANNNSSVTVEITKNVDEQLYFFGEPRD